MTKPMNKIEILIDKLCPTGVEFRELGDVSQYSKHVMAPVESIQNAENTQVQVTEISPGNVVAMHNHIEQTEIIFGLSGISIFMFESKEVLLKPGDVVIISPGELHGARNDTSDPCRFMTVKLNYPGTDDTEW